MTSPHRETISSLMHNYTGSTATETRQRPNETSIQGHRDIAASPPPSQTRQSPICVVRGTWYPVLWVRVFRVWISGYGVFIQSYIYRIENRTKYSSRKTRKEKLQTHHWAQSGPWNRTLGFTRRQPLLSVAVPSTVFTLSPLKIELVPKMMHLGSVV